MRKILLILLLAAASLPIHACTTLLVGKDASSTGFVIVGRNEDDPDAAVRHGYVERAIREGYMPSESGRAMIPEAQSYGYYWIELLGQDGGLTAADSFINEMGVFIGSNNCALSKESSINMLSDGGIEYNLRRIAAERAVSARDAVRIITELIEEYGYAPSGRTYTAADKDEAWVVAVVRGKHCIARRVKDDEVAVIPNHYTIHEIEDGDIYPEDLVSYAYDMHWYDGIAQFDFAECYQESGSYKSEYNTLRERKALSMLSDGYDGKSLPFSVKPEKRITAERIKQILSEHDVADGSRDDDHSRSPRGICTATTAESDIILFADKPVEIMLLSAFGHPCTLPYISTFPLSGNAFSDMDDPSESRMHHLDERPGSNSYRDDIWHRMRGFQYIMEEQDEYTQKRWHITKGILEMLSARGTYDICDIMSVMDRITMKESEASASPLIIGEDLRVMFSSAAYPEEKTLMLYRPLGYMEETAIYPIGGSLRSEGNGIYSAAYDSMDIFFQIPSSGTYEYMISGQDEDGGRVSGLLLVENRE